MFVQPKKPTAILTYNVPQRTLTGAIGQHHFSIAVYSGGGRGSIHPENWERSLKSQLANTPTNSHQRGGTLPSGYYVCEYVKHHPRFGGMYQVAPNGFVVEDFFTGGINAVSSSPR